MLSSGHDMAIVTLNSQELVVSHTRSAHGQASQNYRINTSLGSYWLLEEIVGGKRILVCFLLVWMWPLEGCMKFAKIKASF